MAYLMFVAEETRGYLASLGYRTLSEATGHVERLTARRPQRNLRAVSQRDEPIRSQGSPHWFKALDRTSTKRLALSHKPGANRYFFSGDRTMPSPTDAHLAKHIHIHLDRLLADPDSTNSQPKRAVWERNQAAHSESLDERIFRRRTGGTRTRRHGRLARI